jgi:hypothetical protein
MRWGVFAMPVTYGTAPAVLDDRADRRRQILWSGVLQSPRGPIHCLVTDISRGGARLSVSAETGLKPGQAVTLMVTGMGHFRGTIAWTESGAIGIRFT